MRQYKHDVMTLLPRNKLASETHRAQQGACFFEFSCGSEVLCCGSPDDGSNAFACPDHAATLILEAWSLW